LKKSILLGITALCLNCLTSGAITAARAQWGGPPVIPQLPQQPLSQPPMPQPLPDNYLQPTLKDIPAAPQAVTGNGQENSDSGQENDNPADSSAQDGVKDPMPETQSANEVQQAPAVDDKETLPATGSSRSKTPWLLAAAVVAGAFFLGRRSR
jgi:hypothetical protein